MDGGSLKGTVVVIDIEGTVTTLDFVRLELFGYVRKHLVAFVADNAGDARVAACRAAWGDDVAGAALRLMDVDSKDALLKALQAAVMAVGWASGALAATLFDDVVPALRAWRDRGAQLAVYSSGAIAAQRSLFGHVRPDGNLTALFDGFFDTTTAGPKKESTSYVTIAKALPSSRHVFLTDDNDEATAAVAAGWVCGVIVRPGNRPLPPAPAAPVFHDFGAVGRTLLV